ncbi:MAG: Glycine--tRNA ligase beta subunit [Alphaproteobacteria bacterium MarineAlpha3_Bin6]|nr:MAG: Glycine--tRNA ligase beta subunit [Alphaproteobacteria bacterium MarineAlpha3_Bin6]
MPELLLEILSEEIPARMQENATEDLKRIVVEGLNDIGLDFVSANSYVTPRRIAVVVDGLPNNTPEVSEERRGPRVDAPKKAIDGFVGGLGLTLNDLEKRKTEKGEFYFAVLSKTGQKTVVLLKGLLEEAISKVPWPKSMRWAGNTERWVRPIHSLICIFDGNVIPVSYGSCTADRKTSAHRFLTNALVEVADFADYKKTLETGYVLIDPKDRRSKILGEIEILATKEQLTLLEDQALLDEVVGLVEWPIALMGHMDEAFLEIPQEVLTTTMRKNQKYFSLIAPDGTLAPRFIMIVNKETPDQGASIIAGNERVLRSRLADAKFFWDQDRQSSLESRLNRLEAITFHAKLGTLAEKVARVGKLAIELADVVGANKQLVGRAAQLAKADLVTAIVGEFPEVQGVMGRYYALNDGEAKEVAQAIEEHYAPVGPSDFCPMAPVSVTLALADKIDTLVGFWAIDEKPTGSKDPYALRRAALGIIRLVVENSHRLNLMDAFSHAWNIAGYRGNQQSALEGLLQFFYDRLRVYLRGKGVRHDLISSIFSNGIEDDLVRFLTRVDVLETFLKTDDGVNLLAAYKRAVNILRIEEKKDKKTYDYSEGLDHRLLTEKNEISLSETLIEILPTVKSALAKENYSGAMGSLASTRDLIDSFFNTVTVNCDDPLVRKNRLMILSLIRASFDQIADFSEIEGGER